MNFVDFKNKLANFTVFSLLDIKKIYPNFSKNRLTEWQRKKYILRVGRGYYMFTNATEINEQLLYYVANTIYAPSYVSLEAALSFYNLIPEGVYTITSVTTKKTYDIQNQLAAFSYRNLKERLFFGYKLIPYNNKTIQLADPEKTILDYFYLNAQCTTAASMQELRFNETECKKIINYTLLRQYLSYFNNQALTKRINVFLRTIQYAKPNTN